MNKQKDEVTIATGYYSYGLWLVAGVLVLFWNLSFTAVKI